jgi:hypothetical protein
LGTQIDERLIGRIGNGTDSRWIVRIFHRIRIPGLHEVGGTSLSVFVVAIE